MLKGLEHLQIIERNWSSVCKLKLTHNRITQQEDDPMHKIKSTSERLKKKGKLKCWSDSQNPDLYPPEKQGLKMAVHAQKPTSVVEIKQFCNRQVLDIYFSSI